MHNKIIANIAKITNKNIIIIYFDYLKTKLLNHATLNDYNNLCLYKYNQEEKNSFLTNGINERLIKENNKAFNDIFKNKRLFQNKYHHYLNYNYLYLKDYLSYKEFIIANPEIMINNEKRIVTSKNNLDIYQELVTKKIKLITSYYEPCQEFQKLSPNDNIFIRFLCYQSNIINSYLFIPYKNRYLYAPINLETGIVDYPALDNKMDSYDKSPYNNENIIWFKIPKWPRVKRFIIKVSEFLPEIKYSTIDITITDNTPILLNISNNPEYKYYQLPKHRNNNYGIMNYINKIKKEGIK